MSGNVLLFNCTSTPIYYAEGHTASSGSQTPGQPPLVIEPMSTAIWFSDGTGTQQFVNAANQPVAQFDQANNTFTTNEGFSPVSYTMAGPLSFVMAITEGSTAFDPANWMGNMLSEIGGKTLHEICIPGSHDAGMSQITSHTAQANEYNTITQSQNIHGQLCSGSRYFDIRPVFQDNTFYTGHLNSTGSVFNWQGSTGESIQSIIDGINQFTPGKNELIILKISGSKEASNDYKPFYQETWNTFLGLLSGINALYKGTPANTDLTKNPLSSYLSSGQSQVLVVINDKALDSSGQYTDLSLGSYAGCGFFTADALDEFNEYSDAQDVKAMAYDQLKKMHQQRALNKYFLLSWTLTQNNEMAIGSTLRSGTGTAEAAGIGAAVGAFFTFGLSAIFEAVGAGVGAATAQIVGNKIGTSIRELATQANSVLLSSLLPNLTPEVFPNIIYTDFVENPGPALLAFCINHGMSKKLGTRTDKLRSSVYDPSTGTLSVDFIRQQAVSSPALLSINNPFFPHLLCATRDSKTNALLLNCYMSGGDWRSSVPIIESSAGPCSAVKFGGISYIAYSDGSNIVLKNELNWGKSLPINYSSPVQSSLPPSLVVWNNQLCLAFTTAQNTVEVISCTNPTNNTAWTAVVQYSACTFSTNQSPVLLSASSGNTLILLYSSTPASQGGSSSISTGTYTTGNPDWSTGDTGITDCPGTFAATMSGENIFIVSGSETGLSVYRQKNGSCQNLQTISIAGLKVTPAIWADPQSNRLVIAYCSAADFNAPSLIQSVDGGNTWTKPVVMSQQQGITSLCLFPKNASFSLVFTDTTNMISEFQNKEYLGWTGALPTGHQSLHTPSLTSWKNQVCMAYLPADNSQAIHITCSIDTNAFGPGFNTGLTSMHAPAMAVFNDTLYLAYTADDGSGALVLSSGAHEKFTEWSTMKLAGQSSSGAPSLAVHGKTLYMAYRASDSSNDLYITSSADGVSWSSPMQVPGQSSAGTPSLASCGGNLYMLYRANDSSNSLYITSDKNQWSTYRQLDACSRVNPAIVNYNNSLRLIYGNETAGSNILAARNAISTGQSLSSNNGLFELKVHQNGTVSVDCTVTGASVWAIDGSNIASFSLLSSGQLQALDEDGAQVWLENTGSSQQAAYLILGEDGTLQARTSQNTVVWSRPETPLTALPAIATEAAVS